MLDAFVIPNSHCDIYCFVTPILSDKSAKDYPRDILACFNLTGFIFSILLILIIIHLFFIYNFTFIKFIFQCY